MGTQQVGKKLGITWTMVSLNYLAGCDKCSPGCLRCYASDAAASLERQGKPKYTGLTVLSNDGHYAWNGKIRYDSRVKVEAARWGSPRLVFVNSMSDSFHRKVKEEWQDEMFKVAEDLPQHRWQFLTKRPEVMIKYLRSRQKRGLPVLPQVQLGFSAENQTYFDKRWAIAKEAAEMGWVVWVSVEPQIGPVSVAKALKEGLAWVVTGGESARRHRNAREYHVEWAEALVKECREAKVPVFVKQLGVRAYRNGKRYKCTGEGKHMAEWPESIRVQEFPRLARSAVSKMPPVSERVVPASNHVTIQSRA